ncbi:MAG: ATP-dependent RNA helicase DbpA [Campylobacterales bacterium]|nr:ATP-dependent RNA helicase DbpA [Campylobacterales bacterium]
MITSKKFDELNLPIDMVENLKTLGYEYMTNIQSIGCKPMLDGIDVMLKAKTGSGKTVAFGIPICLKIDEKNPITQSLIICPTRELSDQVAKELRKLIKFKQNVKILTLCGGVPTRLHINSLKSGCHIAIGTAGRILRLLEDGHLNVEKIDTFVLDEADKMLDMGFFEDISKILSFINQTKQTIFISATFPKDVINLSKQIQTNALMIEDVEEVPNLIEEIFYHVEHAEKIEALKNILSIYDFGSTIIFCNTKDDVKKVTNELELDGYFIKSLHGELEQLDRDEILLCFANKTIPILVATDLASRGLDIKNIDVVINFDMPNNKETYIHRIGRTARAGMHGKTINFVTCEDREFNDNLPKVPTIQNKKIIKPKMGTICIEGGKKEKLRATDILGTLTSNKSIKGENVGKIDIFDRYAYVATDTTVYDIAFFHLSTNNIKGKNLRVWKLYS